MAFETTIDHSAEYPVVFLRDTVTGSKVEIYAFGALLNAFWVDGKNIIDGFTSVNDAVKDISNGFKSARLSPFVCRMKHGTYRFNGQLYKTEKCYLPPHAIHGLVYDGVYEIVETIANETEASVKLTHTYHAEDKGYPFKYHSTIVWKLETNHKLTVTTSVTHNNTTAIPFAEGWHPYFTLADSIDDCTLQMNTVKQVEFDETLIPTGKMLEDERFSSGANLKNILLDNCFLLSDIHQPAAIFKSNKLQLTIQPNASYPYVQVYTPPHRQSIAIENLSGTPDCFNNGIGLLLLEPNKAYSFNVSYTVATV
jgi:aldose 1-epimerase